MKSMSSFRVPINQVPMGAQSKLMHTLDMKNHISTIHVILEIDGPPINVKQLRKLCNKKLLCYDKFSSYIDPKSLSWVKTNVDISYHVNKIKLNLNGRTCKKAMEDFVSSILPVPFEPNKPPWMAYILYHDSSEPNYVVLKLSHCLGDGNMLSAILTSLGKQKDKKCNTNKQNLSSKKTSYDYSHYITMFAIACYLLYICGLQYAVTYVVLCLIINNYSLIKKCKYVYTGTPPTCLRATPELVGYNKLFIKGNTMSLFKIKQIGNAIGYPTKATVNDVMLLLISSAISKYHIHRKERVPKVAHMLAITGSNRHQQKKTKKELQYEYSQKETENDISFYLVPLDLSINSNKAHKLHTIQKMMTDIKQSPEHLLALWGLKICNFFLGIDKCASIITSISRNVSDSYISNVVGPSHKMTLCKRPVRAIYNCTSPLKLSITFNILSYGGDITICCASDKNHVPDLDVLVDYIYKEYTFLCKTYL